MKIRFTDTAATEADDIIDYISQNNPRAAIQLNTRITQTLSVLAAFPDMAQMSDEPGVRRMPVGHYPVLIFYTVDNDELVVLHIRHTAREPL